MGEGVNRNMSGKFYLTTNAIEPFGTGVGIFLNDDQHENIP